MTKISKQYSINNIPVFSKDFIKVNGKALFICACLFVLSVDIIPYISHVLLADQVKTNYISPIIGYIETYKCVNFVLLILLLVGTICYIAKERKNKSFSFYHSTWFLLVLVLVVVISETLFPETIIKDLSYKWLFVWLTWFCLAINIYKILPKPRDPEGGVNQYIKGFTSDLPYTLKSNSLRHQYAKELIVKLLKTDIDEESYAIGITGSWGSGKSSFLLDLQIQMQEYSYIVSFNPWNSKDSTQIIPDFFKAFIDCIEPYYGSIEKPVTKYAKLLSYVEIGYLQQLVDSLIENFQNSDTYTTQKKAIENILNQMDKPVTVFIDDMDRLEGNELFEVLKLIRNTAKFKNVYYFAAYDKDYVSKQLETIGISDASSYLEKIFNLEIALPKVEDRDLLGILRKDVLWMCNHVSSINSMFDRLEVEKPLLVLQILNTYRKAKRFARSFAHNANFIIERIGVKDIELKDLFYLELLRFEAKDVYEVLSSNPEFYLVKHIHATKRLTYYSYDGFEGNSLSRQTVEILYLLFSEEIKNKRNPLTSIQYEANFVNYFCLGVPSNNLSRLEFENMLLMRPEEHVRFEMKDTIKEWCLSKRNNKTQSSILRQFSGFKPKKANDERLSNYCQAIYYWMLFDIRDEISITQILPRILNKNWINPQKEDYFISTIQGKLKRLSGETNHVLFAKILSGLYWTNPNNTTLLIENEFITSLLWSNFEHVLWQKKWDALNVVQQNSLLFILLNASNPVSKDADNKLHYHCVIINQLVEWFSREINISQNRKKIETMLNKYLFASVGDTETEWYKQIEKWIVPLFGSKDNCQLFVDNCFCPEK